jgi:hypothetical protein
MTSRQNKLIQQLIVGKTNYEQRNTNLRLDPISAQDMTLLDPSKGASVQFAKGTLASLAQNYLLNTSRKVPERP